MTEKWATREACVDGPVDAYQIFCGGTSQAGSGSLGRGIRGVPGVLRSGKMEAVARTSRSESNEIRQKVLVVVRIAWKSLDQEAAVNSSWMRGERMELTAMKVVSHY